MREVELPDGVGPHEGREFELMRAGSKNVSYFCEIEPQGLDEILLEGFCLLKFKQFQCGGIAIYAWIVFREGCEIQAMRLKEILTDGTLGIHPEREHEIGSLLSYSKSEVDSFIKHALKTLNKGSIAKRSA